MDDVTKCKHWRWMPGMLADDGRVVVVDRTDGYCRYRDGALHQITEPPDLTDPATLGCMLHLVREAWSDPAISIQGGYQRGQYVWAVAGGHHHGATFRRMAGKRHATEAEALVAALEAAP